MSTAPDMDQPSTYFSALRQGFVLEVVSEAGHTDLLVVVSQSCDVVQPKREMLQLAPLVHLEDPDIRRGAIKKVNPRYPLVHDGADPWFADLARIHSVNKATVVAALVRDDLRFTDDYASREFGLAVGRWFGRFAFPDAIQPWLSPVQSLIREKYDSPSKPLGKVLQSVSEIRIEAVSWNVTPAELTLHVVVHAGELPSIPDDADLSAAGSVPEELNAICTAILEEKSSVRRVVLWAAFAAALAARCKPKGQTADDPTVSGAVSSITGEVSADDDFPLSKVRRSEQLDVDYLSEPSPY